MKGKICTDDITIIKDHETLIIQREDGFRIVGNPKVGSGLKNIKSIVNHCTNYDDKFIFQDAEKQQEQLLKIIKDKKVPQPSAAMVNQTDITKMVTVTIEDVTTIVTMKYLKSVSKGMCTNITVLIDKKLSDETLLKLFKATSDAKSAALWDLGVMNHFSFDPLNGAVNDSILVACTGLTDDCNSQYETKVYENVSKCVREAVGESLKKCGFPKDVIGFMEDVGVTVEDLVDAGMELVVGVEKTEEIEIKLRKQILKSLEDLNVVSFVIAGIRLEEDYEKHRVKGVDVDDDPAYFYSDEVFGIAVANQIAGTKATFNFKRYDEAKPGVLSVLGPMLDDVFAGIIAGCMSKIFEE